MELTLLGSDTPIPFDEKSPTDKSQHKKKKTQRLTNQHFFTIQNQWKKVCFWMSNTCDKLKARILVGFVPFFDQKSYVMTLSENKFY